MRLERWAEAETGVAVHHGVELLVRGGEAVRERAEGAATYVHPAHLVRRILLVDVRHGRHPPAHSDKGADDIMEVGIARGGEAGEVEHQ